MDPTPIIDGVVTVVQSNPKTAGLVMLVPAVQFAAPLIAKIPAIWGKGQTSGRGSGWFKFWQKVAAFPYRLPAAK